MPLHKALRGGGRVDNTAYVDPSAYISGDSLIDQWSYIGRGVIVDALSYVATRSFVDDGAILTHATIGFNTFVGKGAIIESGVVVGNRCIICPGARVTANVPDDTTVSSDCSGGSILPVPASLEYSLLGQLPFFYTNAWSVTNTRVYGAPATADWHAAGEPAVALEQAFALPFLNAQDVSIDRIVLALYFARNAFITPTVDGLTFEILEQAGVIETFHVNAGSFLGRANGVWDTPFGQIVNSTIPVGLALTSAPAAGTGFLDMGITLSFYHKNF